MEELNTKKPRWGRKLLLAVLLLLVIIYVAAWFIMKPMIESFADNWVEDQRAAGFEIEYTDRYVEGFPLNFELVFDAPKVQSPGGVVTWTGEQIRLHSRTWDFVAMLTQSWGKLEGYVPGQSSVTSRVGAEADLTLSADSKLEFAWTKNAPRFARISIGNLSGSFVEGAGAARQSIMLDDFVINLAPTNAAGATTVYELLASWEKIELPEQIANDPDTPPMVLALTSQKQEGLSVTIKQDGVFFLGQKIADTPPGLIVN